MTMVDTETRIAALLRAGQAAEARVAAEAALAAGDRSDALLALAGMLAGRARDPAAAMGYFETLLARRPDDRATRINLATALAETGQFARIEAVCAPIAGQPDADRLCAFAAQQQGDQPRAASLYEAVVRAQPGDAGSWNNLGHARGAQGDTEAAIDAFERAITLRPDHVRFYLNLAELLERADRREARARTMRDAATRAPRDPEVRLALGLAEASAGNMDAAEAALRAAVALAPDDPAAYLELGLLLENRNRLEALDQLIAEARGRLGPEIALLEGWAAFRAKRFDEAERFAAAVPPTISRIRRAHLQAQVADRRGDAAAAFALFGEMNAAGLEAPPPPRGPSYRDKVRAATAALVAAAPPRTSTAPAGDGADVPIFVVGFPRSGTTLIDTLLGNVPGLHVLEEQPLLQVAEAAMPAGATVETLDEAAATRLRARYYEALRALAPEAEGQRIVDKHPLHMARMPIIHRLFPTACVLLVERHPMDVVLSCYMANFQLNQAMRSFTSLDEAAQTYDAVFTAWTEAEARLPLTVHRVRYERLVADPAGEVRAMLDFLDLPWTPGVLDNEGAARARGHIRTASYAQVGEAIHQRAAGRWRRYADQLAPIAPVLAPWIDRLGYER